jgi:nitrite reductase/ring-hydroxylating ferredoxin subunit
VSSSLNQLGDDPAGAITQGLMTFDAVPDGGFATVDATIAGATESLVVHRDGSQARAWLNVCPHAGRRLDWSPGQFLKSREGLLICAVHGASFELVNGRCVAGPCVGDRLRGVPVEVRDGWVVLVDARTAASDPEGTGTEEPGTEEPRTSG